MSPIDRLRKALKELKAQEELRAEVALQVEEDQVKEDGPPETDLLCAAACSAG